MNFENFKIEKIIFYDPDQSPVQIKEAFLKVAKNSEPVYFNWNQESIVQELHVASSVVALNESGQVLAFIVFRTLLDEVEIIALGTGPEFSKRGVMKALLHRFAEKCRTESKKIHLEVHEQNIAALGLYLGSGFQIVRRRQNYYTDGGTALVMMLS